VIPYLALRLGEGDRAGADLVLELGFERIFRAGAGGTAVDQRVRVRLRPEVARICGSATEFECDQVIFLV
jgi:hypothetical protein